ncbi:MAG TPA: DUF4412 domain-containing protein [Planctomycetota bacterium]|nr:DUF4412 domain-containing protein [Planctomycetota bacterium]
MRFTAKVALVAILSAPAFCADVVITKSKHSDAMKMPGNEQPAKDTTETTWIGKDRMRIEDGDQVTIIRADQKKMYMLDMKAKTASTIDLPFDLKKYIPAEQAEMMEPFMSQIKVTITPSTETKKIKEWTATKYTMTQTMPMPMGGGITQEIWATKDVQADTAALNDLFATAMSTGMGGAAMANEYKKIQGFPVLVERTQSMMGQSFKSREEVKSIETKDAPEGSYDVPKDFTAKPFDPMAGGPMGGGPGRPGGGGGKPGGLPPGGKPKDKGGAEGWKQD